MGWTGGVGREGSRHRGEGSRCKGEGRGRSRTGIGRRLAILAGVFLSAAGVAAAGDRAPA